MDVFFLPFILFLSEKHIMLSPFKRLRKEIQALEKGGVDAVELTATKDDLM